MGNFTQREYLFMSNLVELAHTSMADHYCFLKEMTWNVFSNDSYPSCLQGCSLPDALE